MNRPATGNTPVAARFVAPLALSSLREIRRCFSTRLVSARIVPALCVSLAVLLTGCGTTAWTDLHAAPLSQSRQFVIQGQRDASGDCFYRLGGLPGTIAEDIARNDSTCQVIVAIGPVLPSVTRRAKQPSSANNLNSSRRTCPSPSHPPADRCRRP